jgi:CheY-like chemotaxis protein
MVNLLTELEGSLEIEFLIKDTGIGITPEQVVHLFKPFSQLDSSMTRKYGGTGLGLAICKTLVELMGGSIRNEQDSENGATFVFTIQAKPFYNSDESHPSGVHKVIDELAVSSMNALHIIIAEDHEVNQKLLQRILEKLGHTVELAENGLEVLELLKLKRFDLIMMDLQMPVMDGFETTKVVMNTIPKELIPTIIAITASTSQEDMDQCAALGIIGFISKPIKIKSVRQVLLQHFTEK